MTKSDPYPDRFQRLAESSEIHTARIDLEPAARAIHGVLSFMAWTFSRFEDDRHVCYLMAHRAMSACSK